MKILATTAALVLLAGSALAQDAAQPGNDDAPAQGQQQSRASANAQVLVAIENDETPVPSLNLMTGQVENLTVIGSDDAEIGAVDEVLGDRNGQPQAIVIEAGGFLGLGQKRIILMLNEVSLSMGRLRTALTENEISELPEYSG